MCLEKTRSAVPPSTFPSGPTGGRFCRLMLLGFLSAERRDTCTRSDLYTSHTHALTSAQHATYLGSSTPTSGSRDDLAKGRLSRQLPAQLLPSCSAPHISLPVTFAFPSAGDQFLLTHHRCFIWNSLSSFSPCRDCQVCSRGLSHLWGSRRRVSASAGLHWPLRSRQYGAHKAAMWLTCSAPADKHAWKYTSFSFSSQDKNVHCRGVGNTAREEKKKIKIMHGLATKGRPLLMFCSVFFGLLWEPQSRSWREALASASPLLLFECTFPCFGFQSRQTYVLTMENLEEPQSRERKRKPLYVCNPESRLLVSTHVPLAFLCASVHVY